MQPDTKLKHAAAKALCGLFAGMRSQLGVHSEGCSEYGLCHCPACREAAAKRQHSDTSQRRIVRRAAYE